jgi:hypothetical protein
LQDAKKLNYDFRNPFVVCGATFTPIYHGQKDVSCPYCTAHFVPIIKGNLCPICELAVVGLQMQVKRKEVKDDTVQQKELAGNLQKVHLRLALLNTVGVCYKGGNFSTAANFV